MITYFQYAMWARFSNFQNGKRKVIKIGVDFRMVKLLIQQVN
jgi:hypothetical protein